MVEHSFWLEIGTGDLKARVELSVTAPTVDGVLSILSQIRDEPRLGEMAIENLMEKLAT
jgi:hypothetical protein